MPTNSREVSVMCRHCWKLVGGVEAGDSVQWVGCDNENQQQTASGEWICSEPLKASWDWMPRWLRKLLRIHT